MKAARSMCGCTWPRPARLAIDRTQRCAVRRSRRWPSWRRRIGPAVRSPMARSIAGPVLGAIFVAEIGDVSRFATPSTCARGPASPQAPRVRHTGDDGLVPLLLSGIGDDGGERPWDNAEFRKSDLSRIDERDPLVSCAPGPERCSPPVVPPCANPDRDRSTLPHPCSPAHRPSTASSPIPGIASQRGNMPGHHAG